MTLPQITFKRTDVETKTEHTIKLVGRHGEHEIRIEISAPGTQSGAIKVTKITHAGLPAKKGDEDNSHFLTRLAVHAKIAEVVSELVSARATAMSAATLANARALKREIETRTSQPHTPLPIQITVLSGEGNAADYFRNTGLRKIQSPEHYVKEVRTRITRS